MSFADNTLHISCGKYKMDNGTIFCPANDLHNALNKLKGITKGKRLYETFFLYLFYIQCLTI